MVNRNIIRWSNSSIVSYINSIVQFKESTYLIVCDDPDYSLVLKTFKQHNAIVNPSLRFGIKRNSFNIVNMEDFCNFAVLSKLQKNSLLLKGIDVVVFNYQNFLINQQILKVPLIALPLNGHQTLSSLTNFVFNKCVKEIISAKSIFNDIEKSPNEIIVGNIFIDFWQHWWERKSAMLNMNSTETISFVIELASSFAYVVNHIREDDYIVTTDEVKSISNNNPAYPYIKKAIEFRHEIPFSSFEPNSIYVPVLSILDLAKSANVVSSSPVTASKADFVIDRPVAINVIESTINCEVSISHLASIRNLASLVGPDNIIITDYADDFDENDKKNINLFSDIKNVKMIPGKTVHIYKSIQSLVELQIIISDINVACCDAVFWLSPVLFDEPAKVNLPLLNTGVKNKKSVSFFIQYLIEKQAKNKLNIYNINMHLNPLFKRISKLIDLDTSSIESGDVFNLFATDYENLLRNTSLLQSKSLLNMSMHDD